MIVYQCKQGHLLYLMNVHTVIDTGVYSKTAFLAQQFSQKVMGPLSNFYEIARKMKWTKSDLHVSTYMILREVAI